MTNIVLNAIVLAALLVVSVPVLRRMRPGPVLGAVAFVCVLTAVFDTLMIEVGLYVFDPDKILGVHVWGAPLEDFAYAIAAAVGMPVLHHKAMAFALSAFFGALGGGLFALQTSYLDPAQFGILESVRLIAIAVIGGLLSPFGPVIGAAVFVLLPETMGVLGRYMTLVFSLLLLLFVVASPQGIAGLVRPAAWRRVGVRG